MNLSYAVGCNYWGSHAGLNMWSDWNADSVRRDFEQLSQQGIRVLRVFPLWNEFQPVSQIRGASTEWVVESHMVENPMNAAELISESRVKRLEELVRLAGECELKLVIALVTGFMSGRQYYPPILENKSLLTDPTAVLLQSKLIEYLVTHFRHCPEIIAWEPGNECNAIGGFSDANSAWGWLSRITTLIRCFDNTRPILNGMHSLALGKPFNIDNVADTCDYLTTHVYPIWTPYCDLETFRDPRSVMHSVGQSLYYAGLSGKPCGIEEIGTLNPMLGDEETVAQYMRAVLAASWAYGVAGCFWWCGYDADSFTDPPYQWCACERELGLFRENREPKAVAGAFREFSAFREAFPFAELPKRRCDALCLISPTSDMWGSAYGAFQLAARAGMDLEFAPLRFPIPEAPVYILPSLQGNEAIKDRYYQELLRRVENGASLLITCGDALLNFFERVCGVVSKGRRRCDRSTVRLGETVFELKRTYAMDMEPTTAEVLARDEQGHPVMVKNRLGKGAVYYLDGALEMTVSTYAHTFDEDAPRFEEVYRTVAATIIADRVQRKHPATVMIERFLSPNEKLVIAVNCTDRSVEEDWQIPAPWRLKQVLHAKGKDCHAVLAPGGLWAGIVCKLSDQNS